jgi:hypothetical protein
MRARTVGQTGALFSARYRELISLPLLEHFAPISFLQRLRAIKDKLHDVASLLLLVCQEKLSAVSLD